jgi:carotenoid cleavage dioxygenase-like enzyme
MNAPLNNLIDNKVVSPQDNPVLQGNFGPVDKERTLSELEVIGTLPPELCGTLLRNGPNPVDPQDNHHWFTGDGMLHAISLADGKALEYRNRWVRTETLEEKTGLKAAPITGPEMLVQGSGNVNIIPHGGRLLALPELGLPYEMNVSLETQCLYDYNGKLASNMTAHPKIDGKSGEMLFFGYDLVAPFLRYHKANKEGDLVRNVDIELPAGVMMHDFGVTARRVIFMDLPVIVDLDLIEQGIGFPFRWDEDHQARLGIMDRDANSDTVTWIDIDPCYVFHTLNSYDDGDKIIMDVVRYRKAFSGEADPGSQLVRWTIDVNRGSVDSRILSDESQEFPRVNPKVECHKHRYGYVLQAGGKHSFGGLFKHDLELGTTQYHDVGERYAAGEPVFVPTGDGEDEGYILSVVYDGETQLSELRVIDAQDFCAPALATVKLNTRIPFGFHGNFIRD